MCRQSEWCWVWGQIWTDVGLQNSNGPTIQLRVHRRDLLKLDEITWVDLRLVTGIEQCGGVERWHTLGVLSVDNLAGNIWSYGHLMEDTPGIGNIWSSFMMHKKYACLLKWDITQVFFPTPVYLASFISLSAPSFRLVVTPTLRLLPLCKLLLLHSLLLQIRYICLFSTSAIPFVLRSPRMIFFTCSCFGRA